MALLEEEDGGAGLYIFGGECSIMSVRTKWTLSANLWHYDCRARRWRYMQRLTEPNIIGKARPNGASFCADFDHFCYDVSQSRASRFGWSEKQAR